MKKLLLSFVLIASVSFAFAQNYQVKDLSIKKDVKENLTKTKSLKGDAIDNADFETWHSDYDYLDLGDMPQGWSMITGNPAGQQSTDAQSGTYAMHVESNVVSNTNLGWTDTLVGGIAFIGQDGIIGGPQKEPYTERPDSVSFFFKGELMSTDTSIVIFELYNDGTYVGGFTEMYGDADISTAWEEKTVTLNYEETLVPDSAAMFVSSTGLGVFQGLDIGTLTAGSYVDIDDMTFHVPEATEPIASVDPDTYSAGGVEIETSVTSGTFTLTNIGVGTLTVNSSTDLSGTMFSTTFTDGDVSLDEGQSYDFTFDFTPTAEGTYNETFSIETNGGTVDIDLSGIGQGPCSVISDYPYSESFEATVPPECWEALDEDGDGFGWEQVAEPDHTAHDGEYSAMSASWDGDDGALTPDNYLITPQFDITADNLELRFWVAAQDSDWSEENYSVMISTSGTAPADFVSIHSETLPAGSDAWSEVVLPLTDYDGEVIYIAFRHHDCTDQFQIKLDDVSIDFATGNDAISNENLSVFPNPANNNVTVENAENADISIYNMVGQKVVSEKAKSNRESINISDLSEGTYMIRIENGDEVNTQKLNVIR
ncbi:MAG: choice-of-anchor J domain-containing protein [Bacteroidota bacterium]